MEEDRLEGREEQRVSDPLSGRDITGEWTQESLGQLHRKVQALWEDLTKRVAEGQPEQIEALAKEGEERLAQLFQGALGPASGSLRSLREQRKAELWLGFCQALTGSSSAYWQVRALALLGALQKKGEQLQLFDPLRTIQYSLTLRPVGEDLELRFSAIYDSGGSEESSHQLSAEGWIHFSFSHSVVEGGWEQEGLRETFPKVPLNSAEELWEKVVSHLFSLCH